MTAAFTAAIFITSPAVTFLIAEAQIEGDGFFFILRASQEKWLNLMDNDHRLDEVKKRFCRMNHKLSLSCNG